MPSKPRRIHEYKSKWNELIDRYGTRCFYCRKEAATCLDHVVPYSYDQVSDIDNLVPCCVLCNALASNKHFEDVEHKRQYILNERSKRANSQLICSECFLPFVYQEHSPSPFLCCECYDSEYGTTYRMSSQWVKWLKELWAAGIAADAHRAMKRALVDVESSDKKHRVKTEYLIDEYLKIMNSDDGFALKMIRP
jgi:5-methylcytosine-specific restriction endonuclease McrA